MFSWKLTILILMSVFTLNAFADGKVCQTLWAEHKAEYAAYLQNASPELLTKAQERLDKSITGHEAVLKEIYAKIDGDTEIRTNLIGIKEKTSQLRKTFEAFTEDQRATLFSSKKRYQDFRESRDDEELFEETLTQEYFGVRATEDKAKESVYKYISSIEDMNWALIQPAYKLLKAKARSSKNEKTWYDQHGIEMEAKVNHYRASGEFVVSICSRLDEEKEFPFLKDTEALPPQFACTRMNIKDGSIEKGMENRDEVKDPKQFQAFLSESFFEAHSLSESCLSYFITHGKEAVAMR